MSAESHMWRETERAEEGGRETEGRREGGGERETEMSESVPSRRDSVPETHVMLLPPQWVTLTGYCLCGVPLCVIDEPHFAN